MKLTTWNIKWFGQLLQGMTRTTPQRSKKVTSSAGKALQRLQRERIALEIETINPDILCIQEGPSTGNIARLKTFCAEDLAGRWSVVERAGSDKYYIGGSQGIFFLVKTALVPALDPTLLPISRWREATEIESRVDPEAGGEHQDKWNVNHPWFKMDRGHPDVDVAYDFGDGSDGADDAVPNPTRSSREHWHYRHPQTLICTIGGKRVDFIGAHLKSKFGGDDYKKASDLRKKPKPTKAEERLIEAVEQVAVEARVKLTTECVNIRHYIDNRFRNEPWPAVFLLGDLNDGIGKEYFERRYLFHDLISNLQGDVFFAQRFLNHALFDYGLESGGDHRWSALFQDAWDPGRAPEVLLDHIMFTQSVTGEAALDRAGVRVHSKAGRVEHDIHEAVNAVFDTRSDFTSDHRPVSVDMTHVAPL
ncbi:hypothetical protein [Hasllibacter sp. MH4015]|uniref:hypothetical protein n=1 Tax=Hasllibacter sp. MH4015 TaxID=2854029 RepID=UPI001CD1EA10|nr:hypothetical protein [Hasllibacter sp. MH4015]